MNCNTDSCCSGGYGSHMKMIHGAQKSRSFLTKEEKIEMLKEYHKTVENEAKGIAEKIAELENEK